jgi:uncharacterized protein
MMNSALGKDMEVRPIKRVRSLQVIIKTAERCNLACTYCYYFFMGDESYKDRDPIIRSQTFPAVVEYLREGVLALGVEEVKLVFHGGEPTLQRPRDFKVFAQQLRETLNPICKLQFAMQTNGYNLSDEWIEAIGEYNVELGFSMDGPQEYHDRYRVTHKGRGSYEQIAKNVSRFQLQVDAGKVRPPGVLSVIDHQAPIEQIFEHFNAMGFTHMAFLLPDRSWEHPFKEGESSAAYGDLLIRLFRLWVENQEVSVREISKVLNRFQIYKSDELEYEEVKIFDRNTQIVVIQSTGEISCDDSLIPAMEWRGRQSTYSVKDTKLSDFVHDGGIEEIEAARFAVAKPCIECQWLTICGGGALENRFSKERGFNNPSVYCDGLKAYFDYIYHFLIGNGYPKEELDKVLNPDVERIPAFVI